MFERLLKQQPQTDDPLKRLKKVSGFQPMQEPVKQVKTELSPITEVTRATPVSEPVKPQGLGSQALTIPSTEKVERVEQPKVSDSYAERIKSEFGYDPRRSIQSMMFGLREQNKLTSEQKQKLGELQGQYITAKQAEDKQVTTGLFGGLTMGATTEVMKRGAAEDVRPVVEEATQSANFGVGQAAGTLGRYALMYSLLGAPIESGFAKLAGKVGVDVTKGLGGKLATEFAKDVVLSAPMTAAESLISGRTIDETKKAVVNDLVLGAVMNGVFEAKTIGKLTKDFVKKTFGKNKAKLLKDMANQGIPNDIAESVIKSVEQNTDWDSVIREGENLLNVRTSGQTAEPIASTRFTQQPINLEQTIQPPRVTPEPPRITPETKIETPTASTMLNDIQKPVDVDEATFGKFRLDLFGATKENPVDAIVDGVNVKVTNVFDEDGIKKAVLSDGRQVDYNSIKPSKNYQPKISNEMENVFDYAKTVKDVGTTSRYTTDVYRNFERVFDKNTLAFKTVKENILDPFDQAKGNMADDVIKYTDGLMDRVVNDLNIKPKSEESALVMRFGEGRIDYEGLIDKVGKEKADNIVRADAWFRKQYDELLDDININRINMNKPVIEKRKDYYRHFNDIANTFENLKNIFESGRAIDPRLSGLSEYTKPREAWASFKQRRTDGTKFTEDAIGGFLDYIKAATYAKHIDPQISNFRTFRNQLANSTTETKNINRFVEYLDDFTNDLAGKTNPFDRWLQKLIGREKLAAVNALNSRVKSNAVLGNLASSLSQIANIPQGVAIVKDPEALTKGFANYIQSIAGKGDANIYKQSSFLKERYLSDAYSQFNMRLIDKPKQAAVWALGVLDEVATKFIWSSAHAKALKNGNLNPIKYADDITRKAVAGRGIGEVPLAQKANAMQLVAPFTVEVNNLWKVMQDMGKEKDIAGLSILFIANHILNKSMEEVRGSGVTFDPIQAVIDGYDSESTFGDNLVGVAGSLGGEALSNLPLGSSIASVYPEYGAKIGDLELPTRAELFGEYDPTRYGISMPIVRAIQDPVKNLLLPFGGAQVSKTIQGAQTLGLLPQNILTGKDLTEKMQLPASVSRSGKIRTGVEVTPTKTAQALLFGGYSLPEVRSFFEGTGVPFGELQTSNIVKLANEGLDLVKLTSTLAEARTVSKKEERQKILEKAGYTKTEVSKILKTFYGYKE